MQLTASAKRAIKRQLRVAWLTFVRSAQPFSCQDLLFGFWKVGVRPGSVLFVHSSFDRFTGFVGKVTDVNLTLLESVGTTGTVVMPTLPFSGTAVDYVSSGAVFDARKTPSRMGLLTELFRRHQGTVRSVHPTHSVAAFGTLAEQLTAGHHLAKTPCGEGTPYGHLLDAGGQILFMGTDISVMTFFHHVEEKLEPLLPFSPFTRDTFVLHSRDMKGNLLTTETRLFDPRWSRKRNLNKLIPFLKRHRVWNEFKVGRLTLILLSADAVLSTCRELAAHGIYAYDS
jgi:aminoglycoside 3-N-acetyltransferase